MAYIEVLRRKEVCLVIESRNAMYLFSNILFDILGRFMLCMQIQVFSVKSSEAFALHVNNLVKIDLESRCALSISLSASQSFYPFYFRY